MTITGGARQAVLRGSGQSTMELAIFMLVLVGALFAMQVYIKRGIQGQLRLQTDSIGQQYDPLETNATFTTNHISNSSTSTTSVPAERWNCPGGATPPSPSCSHWTVLQTQTVTETILDQTNSTGNEVVGGF